MDPKNILTSDKERAKYTRQTQRKCDPSFHHFSCDAGLLHQILVHHIIPSMSWFLTPLDSLECVCHPIALYNNPVLLKCERWLFYFKNNLF